MLIFGHMGRDCLGFREPTFLEFGSSLAEVLGSKETPEMTDFELEEKLRSLVQKERRITQEILELIREAERRSLHLIRGYPSLYEWLVSAYGFSRAAAYRRVQAAKLISEVPAVREKMLAGELNLTTVAQLQSAVRKEEKRIGEKFGADLKQELVSRIEKKSPEETAKILTKHFPEVVVKKESLRVVAMEHSRLVVTLEEKDAEALKRVHALLSNACPTFSAVVAWLVRDYLKRKDPMRKMTH
jgi:hypothetical protein